MASNSCSFSLTGFFALKAHERRRTTTVRRDGSTGAAFHLFYDTDLLCGKLKSMPATVRIYSPPGDAPLANDTVAYVNAKCHVPASITVGPILLDASELTALAGDPSHADYEKGLPDFKSPSVVGLGFVDGPVQGPPNGIVTFHVRVSEFVRGGRLESVIICRQDKGSSRWKNFPQPTPGGPIQVQGNVVDAVAPGQIVIELESAVFCSQAWNPPPEAGPTPPLCEPASPSAVKKRKFGPRSVPLGESATNPQGENQNSTAGPSSQSSTHSRSHAAANSTDDEERVSIQLLGPDSVLSESTSNGTFPATSDNDVSTNAPTAPSTRSKGKRKADI
ncbi:hypothetical protein BJV77DRAFT_1162000 [Russula vinacea]|nr:hypothetical protein BJV77DRAFT_1162000 [Russula vinacea]